MRKYEESLKIYRDNYNTLEYAKKEARKEGREEGKQEGRKEERFEIAKMLKKNGASIELITKSTGLSREEVEALN